MRRLDEKRRCFCPGSFGGLLILISIIPGIQAQEEEPSFSLGADKKTVFDIQGPPKRVMRFPGIEEDIWWYGSSSSVTFKNGKVVTWQNSLQKKTEKVEDRIRIHLGDKDTEAPPFTLGSTKQEVVAAQGDPDRVSTFSEIGEEIWWYPRASVTFVDEKVVAWDNIHNVLNVGNGNLQPDQITSTGPGISKEVILALRGTPRFISRLRSVNQEIWWYDKTSITLTDNIVTSWLDLGDFDYEGTKTIYERFLTEDASIPSASQTSREVE